LGGVERGEPTVPKRKEGEDMRFSGCEEASQRINERVTKEQINERANQQRANQQKCHGLTCAQAGKSAVGNY
jgi:hypothetical protein